MLAASPQVANATPASGSDGAAAPANAVDGFAAALAGLMAILGQPVATPTVATGSPGGDNTGASSAGERPFLATGPGLATDATNGVASGTSPVGSDALSASATIQTATMVATPLSLSAFAARNLPASAADAGLVADAGANGPAQTQTLLSAQPPSSTPAAAAGLATATPAPGVAPVLPAGAQATSSAADAVVVAIAVQTPSVPSSAAAAASAPPASATDPGSKAAADPTIDPRLLPFTARADTQPAPPPTDAATTPPTSAAADNSTSPGGSPAATAQSDSTPPQLLIVGASIAAPPPRNGATQASEPPSGSKATRDTAQSQATGAASPSAPAKASAAVVAKVATAGSSPSHTEPQVDESEMAGGQAQAGGQGQSAAQPALDAPAQPTAAPLAGPAAPNTAQPSSAPVALAQAHGAEITAQLAAQIAQRPTRTSFDFALEPQGLGRVDVSLKFDPQGQVSAVLSFDNPSAAAEARGRASDLQQALQQAGLDVSQSGLSFTSGGGQGHGAAWQPPAQSSVPQTQPSAAEAASTPITPTPSATAASGGLDIVI